MGFCGLFPSSLKPLVMHRASTIATFLAFLLLTFFHESSAQYCRFAPPLDSCDGSGPAVANNDILGVGVKKWFYGPVGTLSQITLRGGTLVVCGNLTLSNALFMDSGTIVIRPGATLTAGGSGGTGMIWQGGCAVYNYGTFNITTNITMEGPYSSATRPNIVMNVTANAFIKSFNYFVINSAHSSFVNNGKMETSGIITDAGSVAGSVCLGPGSQIKQSTMINKIKNAYTAPYGHGCVQVTFYAEFLDSMAANPGVLACVAAGTSTATGSGKKPWAWGRAQVFSACAACGTLAVLPLTVTKFNARPLQQGYQLSWQTGLSSDGYQFIIERSTDGIQFSAIDSFSSVNSLQYIRQDIYAPAGTLYYRLRYYSDARQVYYSTMVKVYNDESVAGVEVFPNPFTATVRVNWLPGRQPKTILVLGTAGDIIYQAQPDKIMGGLSLPLPPSLPPGNYIIRIVYPEKVLVRKIVKELR
jgi:hypothetical protein